MEKFMQSLETPVVRKLKGYAKKRNLGMQEFIRAIVIPEWIESKKSSENSKSTGSRTSTATV